MEDNDSGTYIGHQSGALATGSDNTGIGNGTLDILVGGSNNVAIGSGAGGVLETGIGNICIGYNTDTSGAGAMNQIVIANDHEGTGDNEIALGNTDVSAIKAQVTTITAYSDKRIKKDIITNDLGLDFITKLRPVKYNKSKSGRLSRRIIRKKI